MEEIETAGILGPDGQLAQPCQGAQGFRRKLTAPVEE